MKRHPDEWIISHLQSADKTKQEEGFVYLHEQMSNQVGNYILKNNGKVEDIDDIFQDGLIYLYKIIKKDQTRKIQNLEAYFFTICRNLWLKELKRRKKSVSLKELQNLESFEDLPIHTMLNTEREALLFELMKQLGESCHQILIYFYYDKLNMKEIAANMNLSSDQVAKNKKSNCLKKLRTVILASAHYKSIFKKD